MRDNSVFCDDALKSLLEKDEYANQQLLEARNRMCNNKVTEEQWQEIRKIVGLILFYSSKKLKTLAEATLLEMIMREPYMLKYWNKGD